MIFILLSTLLYEIPIWIFLTHFCVDDVTTGESKLQNIEIVVSKWNTSPQISIYYWLLSPSITIGTWNTSLGPFSPNFRLMTSPQEVFFNRFDINIEFNIFNGAAFAVNQYDVRNIVQNILNYHIPGFLLESDSLAFYRLTISFALKEFYLYVHGFFDATKWLASIMFILPEKLGLDDLIISYQTKVCWAKLQNFRDVKKGIPDENSRRNLLVHTITLGNFKVSKN